MAKKDMVSERSKGTNDEVFAGNKDGTPDNGPLESGGGAGETTRLAEGPKGNYRSSITDNPGNMPYSGGTNEGKGNTQQDSKGDADLYAEKSNDGVGDEHQESAGDQDVDTYYRELSKRRPPNYSKTPSLQTKQAPLDLAPVDGGDGFVGSNTGPAVGFNYITGKKGFSEDVPVWEEVSTFKDYPDATGSTTPDAKDIAPGAEDSRDEFAPWKHVDGSAGQPQTAFTKVKEGGSSAEQEGVDGGGNPDTQSIPDAESGDTDMAELPTTEYTHNDNGGAPAFKFAGVKQAESVYMPKPRE